MDFRKWSISFLCLTLALLLCFAAVTGIIDPFFHYHKPLAGLEYELFYQRYQNDGIVRHFDYDAVITGNSMSENFRTSECDALFSVRSVKVPFSGASPKELDMNTRAALKANSDVKLVIMNLDWSNFIKDKDTMSYDDEDYPDYLYNSNPFDDVKYLLNKDIFKTSLSVLADTLTGKKGTSFDDYSFWGNDASIPYGKEAILASFDPGWFGGEIFRLDDVRREILTGNVAQNLLAIAQENPQIRFYYFLPPYSMYFWAKMYNIGELELQFEAQEAVFELLLEQENISLFSFLDEFELAQDFSRYKDYIHYDADVNSRMLECMAKDEHRITKENYRQYFDACREFYLGYDYESLLDDAA